ncbi:putative esterase [Scheffersomyces xylosifermentans]|uniref:putative esterase n=1 Tax=Scheffersomyces xylosifermentans TaxID=1304137 RepID=UPI00315D0582
MSKYSNYTVQPDFSFAGGLPPAPYKLHESVVQRLDSEYVDFFNANMTNGSSFLYTHRTPLKDIRKGGNVMPGQTPLSKVAKIFDIAIPRVYTKGSTETIPARVFVPEGERPTDGWPLFIWYHGGGWVLGNISTENSFCTKVASMSNCVVISVDYRLAPEDPFPAGVDDAFESVLYGFEVAPKELGINNKKIAIGGSSAGGNLTAVVTHKFANSKLSSKFPPVVFQVLVVPVTDNTATPENKVSWKENEFTPQLPAEKMIWYRYLYLPNAEDVTNPEASPLFYSDESFAKVPPCFIAAAGCDVLRTEAEEYYQKLQKNGIKSIIRVYPGVPHPVMAMDAVLSKGVQLIKDVTDALSEAYK